MVITLYLRDTNGPSLCGQVGTPKELVDAIGSSVNNRPIPDFSVGLIAWNKLPNINIASGTWTARIDITCPSGGGPPNRVTCLVERRSNTCVLQETMINVEQQLNKGTTEEIVFEATGVSQKNFSATDVLVITFSRTNGNQLSSIEYDGAGALEDSLLESPDEFVPAAIGEAESGTIGNMIF